MKIFRRAFLALGALTGLVVGVFLGASFIIGTGKDLEYDLTYLLIVSASILGLLGFGVGLGLAFAILLVWGVILKKLEDPTLTDNVDTYLQALRKTSSSEEES